MMNDRMNGGYSLRKSLENQGVTTEEAMRGHLGFVYECLPFGMDITRYRVNSENPNAIQHG